MSVWSLATEGQFDFARALTYFYANSYNLHSLEDHDSRVDFECEGLNWKYAPYKQGIVLWSTRLIISRSAVLSGHRVHGPTRIQFHGTGSEYRLPTVDMTSNFQLKVLSADQLLQEPSILNAAVSLVNTTYLDHKVFNGQLRFSSDDQLCAELESGLCAVLLEKDGDAVATASVKLWTKQEKEIIEKLNGFVYEVLSYRLTLAYEKDSSNEHHFELLAVASRNETKYRKKGLVEKCIKALESQLFERLSKDGMQIRVTFWVRVVADINGEYWRRRGFSQFGQGHMMPKGTWRASDPFLFITMSKSVTKNC